MPSSTPVALVTGANAGLGRFAAQGLVEAGYHVIGTSRDVTGLEPRPGVILRNLDVTSDDDWRAAVELTVSEFGRLDVLFNNAGIFNGGQLQRYQTEQWQQMLDVNLTGAFLGIRAAADAMIASGGGSIINTSSIEGLRGTPWAHGYVASKWGLRGLTKSVALELAPHGIRVNSLHPGRISTPATDAMPADMIPIPLGRPGQPEEVASFVVFLASDESSFATGSEFTMDGGTVTAIPTKF